MTTEAEAMVAQRVHELFASVGVLSPASEAERIWAEFAEDDTPDHAALAKQFRRIARARNPFDRALCDGEARRTFERKVQRRWAASWRRKTGSDVPSIDLIDWYSLSPGQQAHVRVMANELAFFHKGFVRRGAPRKNVLDTLLLGLADIFIERDESAISVLDLASATTSRFIIFCSAQCTAIAGSGKAIDGSQVTPSALSSRWHRLKKDAGADVPAPTTARSRTRCRRRRTPFR